LKLSAGIDPDFPEIGSDFLAARNMAGVKFVFRRAHPRIGSQEFEPDDRF
jgi:hypothetical protein